MSSSACCRPTRFSGRENRPSRSGWCGITAIRCNAGSERSAWAKQRTTTSLAQSTDPRHRSVCAHGRSRCHRRGRCCAPRAGRRDTRTVGGDRSAVAVRASSRVAAGQATGPEGPREAGPRVVTGSRAGRMDCGSAGRDRPTARGTPFRHRRLRARARPAGRRATAVANRRPVPSVGLADLPRAQVRRGARGTGRCRRRRRRRVPGGRDDARRRTSGGASRRVEPSCHVGTPRRLPQCPRPDGARIWTGSRSGGAGQVPVGAPARRVCALMRSPR